MDDLERHFDEHAQALYRYLVRLTGDADLAADGVQDTFVRLLERGPTRGVQRAWLFTVATNSVLGELRPQSRRRRILDAGALRAPLADQEPSPHDRVEALERHDRTMHALLTLSEKERTALLMREEGFSHREIADALGTTTGSVGTFIARALLKFVDALPPGSEEA